MGLVALLLAIEMGSAAALEPPPRFAAMYDDPAVFEQALAKESGAPPAGHYFDKNLATNQSTGLTARSLGE